MTIAPTPPPYVSNNTLFQDYYLATYAARALPLVPTANNTPPPSSDIAAAQQRADAALATVQALWAAQAGSLSANESHVEDFVQAVCAALGFATSTQGVLRRRGNSPVRPDVVCFASHADRDAYVAHKDDPTFAHATLWQNVLTLIEVKQVEELDKRRGGELPAEQLLDYLEHAGKQWGILTDGVTWRLYHHTTPHDLTRSCAVSLRDILTLDDPAAMRAAFAWFYALFAAPAFANDAHHLERLLRGSSDYAVGVQTQLQRQAFRVVGALARGIYAKHPTPATADLKQIYDQAIAILYRLLFVKYAEDRYLLPVSNRQYQHYGYRGIEDRLMHMLATHPGSLDAEIDDEWVKFKRLTQFLGEGNLSIGIFAYNGRLFKEDYQYLDAVSIPDRFFAEAVSALAAVEQDGERVRVDYSNLAVQHLGNIYEGLLDFHLVRDGDSVKLVSSSQTDVDTRHETGSYYTPDYIVRYIVQQVLKPLCYADVDDPASIRPPNEIAQLRVLDPACGSGHFLVEVIEQLADTYIASIKKHTKNTEPVQRPGKADELYNQRRALWQLLYGGEGSDESADEQQQREANLRQYAYRVIIEQCIYGVDLNPLAVELTRLSLWLRTLSNDKPLSFLDHHIRHGNSLVGARFANLRPRPPRPTRRRASAPPAPLTSNMFHDNDFTSALDTAVDTLTAMMQKPSNEAADVRQKMDDFSTLQATLNATWGRLADVTTATYFDLSLEGTTYDRVADHIKGRASYDDPHTQAALFHAPALAEQHAFFHWELAFPEVFFDEHGQHRGAAAGFDAVVGNPPYVRQELLKPYKPYWQETFASHAGTADLYVYFYEQGINLLRDGGRLGYITSNKYFRAGYGKPLREWLTTHATLERIVDFGDAPIFAGAVTYPAIVVARRAPPSDDSTLTAYEWHPDHGDLSAFADTVASRSFAVAQPSLTADGWQLAEPALQALLDKLRAAGTPLGAYVNGELYYGIKTGLNEAFVIDRATRDRLVAEDPASAAIIKPFLRGRDVKRWRIEFDEQYLIFTRRGIDIDQYPAVKRHLEQYKDRLMPGVKGGRARGDYAWYELQASPGDVERFEQPKIIYPDIAPSVQFAYDPDGSYYTTNTTYILPTTEQWLVGLLNSKTLFWFYQQITSEIRGNYVRFFTQYVTTMPIPTATEAQRAAVAARAEACSTAAAARFALEQDMRRSIARLCDGTPLSRKLADWWELDFATLRREVKRVSKRDIPVSERNEWEDHLTAQQQQHAAYTATIAQHEHELNALVYALYGLTDDEIALIEGNAGTAPA